MELHVYSCELDPVEKLANDPDNKVDVEISLDVSKQWEFSDTDKIYPITATWTKVSECSGGGPTTSSVDVTYEYTYSVTATRIDKTEKDREHSFSTEATIPFTHSYDLINSGPSPIDKLYRFEVLVPKIVSGEVQPDLNFNCTTAQDSGEDAKDDGDGTKTISCSSSPCTTFTCFFIKPDRVNTPTTVTLQMTFDPLAIRRTWENFETFEVITVLENNGASIELTDTFADTAVGSLKSILQLWPIFVGIGVGIVALAPIVYVTYRHGLHNKVRFVKMEDKE